MGKYTEIGSSAEFERILRANKVVVADFHAEWCGPCKQIAPVYDQLATSHSAPGRLAFVKINVDNNQDITQKYGVSAMPTFLIFKNGSVSETIKGANPSALRSAVSSAVAEASRGGAAGGASAGPVFETKGYRLGNANEPTRTVRPGGSLPVVGNVGGMADGLLRFAVLYFTTLFSFDAYTAAEASPFSVKNKRS